MARIIDLPKLSPTMEEGTLVRWVKNEGERVEIDDLLAEVETDKATMEFRAFDQGTLLKRLVAEGAVVRLGGPVAILGAVGEDIAALLAQASTPAAAGGTPAAAPAASAPTSEPMTAPTAPTVPPAADRVEAVAKARSSGPASPIAAATPGLPGLILLPEKREGAGAPTGVADVVDGTAAGGRTTPRVRRIARERGVALERVRGTGANGRITIADVDRAATAQPVSSSVLSSAGARPADTSRPASSMRKTIARRLTESKRDVPHFYLEADLDVDALLVLREELNRDVEKDARVSVTDLLVRACALALREVPASNASWSDGTIVTHHRIDISLAVAVEDGLVTPVLRDVDQKPIRAIAAEAKALAVRARARKLQLEEMQGGVFSLSNLGMYGIDRFSAVINAPESMILAVGATRDVAIVRDGAVVPGRRCAVTLSCDHRVVDGALGAQFLQALRGLVEHPVRILA